MGKDLKRQLYTVSGTAILVIVGIILATVFKSILGAPNYGLGVVIAVTTICYYFGIYPATISLAILLYVVHFLDTESSSFDISIRLLVIMITSALTSYLVIRLRSAMKELNEALARETKIAATMQRAFMPRVPHKIRDVSIYSLYEPGSNEADLGGDFLDTFELPNGLLSVALGDVSGKGIDAARQAVIAECGLRTYAIESIGPAEVLRKLNNLLVGDLRFNGFITLFHAMIDPAEGIMTYSTGGHESPIIYRANDGAIEFLVPNGMLLGAIYDADEKEDAVKLNRGDIIFIFSDGLSESRTVEGFIGSEGVGKILLKWAKKDNLEEVVMGIVGEIREVSGGVFRDDMAILALRLD